MKYQKNNGFTLLEMLVTMGIVGILMTFALPGMNTFIKNNRLTTQINSLVSHLQYARSLAIKKHRQIIVCASSDGTTCSGSWNDGWIVFNDDDGSGDITGNEAIKQVRDSLQGATTLGSSNGTVITFDTRGFAPNSAVTFSLCDDRGAAHGKAISISNTGRIRNGGTVTC